MTVVTPLRHGARLMLSGIIEQAEGDGLTVLHLPLPGWAGDGLLWPKQGRWYILVRHGLPRPRAAEVVAHELAHWRRGLLPHHRMPDTWWSHAAREETACDLDASTLLLDVDELEKVVALAEADGVPLEAWEVAEEFDVPYDVARRACELLRRRRAS